MSGAFGWNDNKDDYGHSGNGGGFTQAINRHKSPVASSSYTKKNTTSAKKKPVPKKKKKTQAFRDFDNFAKNQKTLVPDGKHYLTSTASNVLVVVSDMTGSMGAWPKEIFKRLPLLYTDVSRYLETDDLEILFIAHGDARTDRNPIQVAQFGKGRVLDGYLTSFVSCGGGGQGTESHELVAYFIEKHVDLSSAQNVYTYFLTDEAACDDVSDRHVREYLGDSDVDRNLRSTKNLFGVLKRKMKIFTVLCETDCYDPTPIRHWWERTIGKEYVLHLSDARRVVDVMLCVIAKLTGQIALFESDLKTRQFSMPYGKKNVNTVMETVCLVGRGTPSDPFALPDGMGDDNQKALPPPNKTRSLLD